MITAKSVVTHVWRTLSCLLLLCIFHMNPAAGATMNHAEAQELFTKANEEYRNQRYAEARSLYQTIVDAGLVSADVYYNLANCSARLGQTGAAVLYYEKALSLAPRDNDARANLERVAPPGYETAPFVLALPFYWVLNLMNLQEWMVCFFSLLFLTALIGAILLSRKAGPGAIRPLKFGLVAGITMIAFVGVFTGARYSDNHLVVESVVMKPGVVARSGPGENFTQIAALAEGTKVERVGDFSDPHWDHVKLPAGQTAYILREAVQPI